MGNFYAAAYHWGSIMCLWSSGHWTGAGRSKVSYFTRLAIGEGYWLGLLPCPPTGLSFSSGLN